MADIVHFPPRRTLQPSEPFLSIVGGIDHEDAPEIFHGDRLVAAAMADIASAIMLIRVARAAASDSGMDSGDLISNEVVISLCGALTNIIDARGCGTAERNLRGAAMQAVSYLEGSYNDG